MPASPITMAAITGPTPNRPVMEVPDALTTAASFFSGLRQLAVQAAQVSQQLGSYLAAGLPRRAGGRGLLDELCRLGGGDLLRQAARDQAAAPRAAGTRPRYGTGPDPGAGGSSRPACSVPAGTRSLPSGSSAPLIATAVCDLTLP